MYKKKPVLLLPFSLRKQIQNKKISDDTFTVVYPSSINTQRKRYRHFIELAKNNPQDRFVVLGETAYKNIESQAVFEEMSQVSNIQLSDCYVPIKEFQRYMQQAHILFSDIVVNYNSADISEIYGVTKDTGVSYLMAEFELPCLLNSEFNNLQELNRGSLYFSNFQELEKKYAQIKKREYREICVQNLKEDLSSFTVEHFSSSLRSLARI